MRQKSIVPLASASLTGDAVQKGCIPLQGPRGVGAERRQVRSREGEGEGKGRPLQLHVKCFNIDRMVEPFNGILQQWHPQGGGDLPATCPQTWLHLKEPFDRNKREQPWLSELCLAESSPANKVLAESSFL